MVARALADRLERGTLARGALARGAAWAWGRAVRVERPLVWPDGVRVLTVGGATLGGSGKTPLAIALARHAAERGEAVALIGHAYGAKPGPARARVVRSDDAVQVAGDEAIVCARALEGCGARVVVAPKRQAAVDFAIAHGARVLVVDGALQTTPRRADLALLAVDADAPWGAGLLPPMGDLRAPVARLLGASDAVVPIDDACIRSRGARVGSEILPWSELRSMRLGLVTCLARPERLIRWLSARGVMPVIAIHRGDHAVRSSPRISASEPVDAWIATEKCALHVGAVNARRLLIVEYVIDLQAIASRSMIMRDALARALP
jgi:tetraacyldisaccharide 4'-kinase